MRRLTHPIFTIKNETISLLLAYHNSSVPHGNMHFRAHTYSKNLRINLFEEMNHCHDNHEGNHQMKMYFNFDLPKEVLFEFININDNIRLIIACIILFILSIIHQFLYCIVRFTPKIPKKKERAEYYEDIEGSVQDEEENTIFKKFTCPKAVWYIVKPIAFLFQLILGYFLMLLLMSYQAGFFIAIVVGNVLGWTVFSMSNNIEPENCCQ